VSEHLRELIREREKTSTQYLAADCRIMNNLYKLTCIVLLNVDEFNEFCDRLETTAEWGGQAEVLSSLVVQFYQKRRTRKVIR